MAFTVTNAANSDSGLTIDAYQTNTLDVNVVAGVSPSSTTTYWTIDCGTDNKSSNWSLSYAVAGNDKTGKWVFTKGKLLD
jgi:hypothetical protein